MRRDCFEILEYARGLALFNKAQDQRSHDWRELKRRASRILASNRSRSASIPHLPEIHDAITKLPGSLRRSLQAIRYLRAEGVKVSITNVLMKQNVTHAKAVRLLAKELDVDFVVDPTITPMLNGDRPS